MLCAMNPATYSPAVLAPDNYAFRELEWRAPKVPEGDAILIEEPGRVLDNICYRAYCFRVSKGGLGDYMLRVRHGGGDEAWKLDYCKRTVTVLQALDSDGRFILLHSLMRAHQETRRVTAERVEANWRQAAAEKRIKTRKVKGGVKVWVEPKVIPAEVNPLV